MLVLPLSARLCVLAHKVAAAAGVQAQELKFYGSGARESSGKASSLGASVCGVAQTLFAGLLSFVATAVARDTTKGVANSSRGRADHRVQQSRQAMNEIFQFTARELGDHPRPGLPGLVGPEPRIETDSNVFVTIVSHELRTSLGAIRSATRILCVDTSACGGERARMLIERQVAKMTSLIAGLLDVSRSQHTPMQLQCERNDLCAIAAHAARRQSNSRCSSAITGCLLHPPKRRCGCKRMPRDSSRHS